MKYDPIKLIKLNLTESGIQKQRDSLLDGMANAEHKTVVTIIHKVYLPFIIDMLDDYEFMCKPYTPGMIKITIIL